jgi:hypothetical protein
MFPLRKLTIGIKFLLIYLVVRWMSSCSKVIIKYGQKFFEVCVDYFVAPEGLV